MARFNLANLVISPLNANIKSFPIALCAKPEMPPHALRATIDWAALGGGASKPDMAVEIDLTTVSQVTPALDAIRSVQIDNTFSAQSVYVFFEDTGFQVWAPPNSTVIWPVMTNNQKAVIYIEGLATGSVPVTNVHFSNVNVDGAVIQQGGSGGVTPISPIDITFTDERISTVGGDAGTNAWNFAAVDFGTPLADRLIVVACTFMTQRDGVATGTIVNATIGGVAATGVIQSFGAAAGGTSKVMVAILQALVPAGATGAIAITTGTTGTDVGFQSGRIGVYSLSGYGSATPLSFDADGQSALGATAVVNAVVNGSVTISVAVATGSASPFSWSGGIAPDDFNTAVVDSVIYSDGYGSAVSASNGTISPGTICNRIAAATWS